jgi:hypothetical protein
VVEITVAWFGRRPGPAAPIADFRLCGNCAGRGTNSRLEGQVSARILVSELSLEWKQIDPVGCPTVLQEFLEQYRRDGDRSAPVEL